ncbi:phosphatidate cytidylyltransferase [Brevibacillus fulvus]|uniref:Phosphatidate cytidylyltransferase n=1 Tax=Brevibacillus fulvus TaxID=1125967 RepID=A0A938Y3L6_9BACL|nr:phosphatidate cytidylyltransferase [Brevibacillus fulvus]MBM7590590.1 phosphatidate cytidylyltransferase [Brevibacillus fulvus]
MKQRIVTGLIGGIIFIGIVYLGNSWFSLLVLLLALGGLYEFLRMAKIPLFSMASLFSFILMLGILLPNVAFASSMELSVGDVLLPVMLLLFIYSVWRKNQFHIEHVALTILGALYIGYGFTYMLATRNLPEHGLLLTFLVVFGIWATDTGAYFVGKAVGRRKLWPAISPNKTLEGSLGGLVLAVLVVALLNQLGGSFSFGQVLGIGLTIGIAGQLGDLVESAIKRHFGVKDSGQILPGHGGVLDRFDSLLFVFPILHLSGMI